MTLKLSTFLLPSNQFALIAEFDEDSRGSYDPVVVSGLEEFAKNCGAVDVLVTNYPVIVEDAILSVSYPAERADDEAWAVDESDDELAERERDLAHWKAREEELDTRGTQDILTSQVEQLPGSPVSPELLAAEVGDVQPWTPQLGETVVAAVGGSIYGTTMIDGAPLLGQELVVVGRHPKWGHLWLDTDPAGAGLVALDPADVLPLSAV